MSSFESAKAELPVLDDEPASTVTHRRAVEPDAGADQDFRFIESVLADMIEFANLNRLDALGRDLTAARASFRREQETRRIERRSLI